MSSFFSPTTWLGSKKEVGRLPACGQCGLLRTCSSPKLAPEGPGRRKVLFLDDAPGETDDKRGKRFQGKSGALLRETLKRLGCDLDNCIKHSALSCRPPNGKIEEVHIQSCRPLVLNAIRDFKPEVIVLLGGSAVRSLMPAEREADVGAIARWVGWRIPSHEHQAWICPTYHPSYLLRMKSPVLDMMFEQHLKRALAKEGKPIRSQPLEVLKTKVECIKDPVLARARVRDLSKKSGVLAFDYESNSIKPDHPKCRIYAVSFCLDGEDTFSVLVDDNILTELSKVLKNPKLLKVASNLKNEERWTRAILGHPVKSWTWDTMLAAHVLDNRQGITSLKFQAFVRFGIADYGRVVSHYFESGDDGFNRIDECPKDEMLQYCGLDSLLEYRLCMVQRKEMGLPT